LVDHDCPLSMRNSQYCKGMAPELTSSAARSPSKVVFGNPLSLSMHPSPLHLRSIGDRDLNLRFGSPPSDDLKRETSRGASRCLPGMRVRAVWIGSPHPVGMHQALLTLDRQTMYHFEKALTHCLLRISGRAIHLENPLPRQPTFLLQDALPLCLPLSSWVLAETSILTTPACV